MGEGFAGGGSVTRGEVTRYAEAGVATVQRLCDVVKRIEADGELRTQPQLRRYLPGNSKAKMATPIVAAEFGTG
ncbi:hypothetical protein ACFQBQ_17110 [Granulicella cerasi]|uniref:Uncharacterized protein n=1 Tax=Granulicella cerasi TaxID=741063 RepID=A0ABW1ZGG6_9BACT|nr:hypothetical protein [Granulicella cerasi]